MEKTKCVFISKRKKIILWEGDFEKIYDNSGILKPTLAGFIRYLVFEEHLEMKQIFVSPEYRKMGYGRLLVERLIELAKDSKKKEIVTISGVSRGETFGDFLEKMRFAKGINKNWTRELWKK